MEHAFTALVLRTLRRLAVEEGLRADGRGLIDCRELHCEVGEGRGSGAVLLVFGV